MPKNNLQILKEGLIKHSKGFYNDSAPSVKTFWEPYHKKLNEATTVDQIKKLVKAQFFWGKGEFNKFFKSLKP